MGKIKKILIIFLVFLFIFPFPCYSLDIKKENGKIIMDEVTFNLLVKDARLKVIYEDQIKELEDALNKLDNNRKTLKKLNEENEYLLNKKIDLQKDIIQEYKGQKEKYKEIENLLNRDIKKLKRKKLTSDILVGILAGTGIALSDNSDAKIAIGSATALYFILTNN